MSRAPIAAGCALWALSSVLSAAGAQAACPTERVVHKTNGPFVTIQSAVLSLPASLSGTSCVVIEDDAVYEEQVTVEGFANNGWRLAIMAGPGARPAVSPPAASTAAFRLRNASVSVMGIDIRPANAVPYGIQASSAYVEISSVSVDGGSSLYRAGIVVSTANAVSHASVTVRDAHGIWVQGSTATVAYSTAVNDSASSFALYVNGVSSGTFTALLAGNAAGDAVVLDQGARFNVVSLSTAASASAAAVGLRMSGASWNTVAHAYARNPAGQALRLEGGASGNVVADSTMTSAWGGHAVSLADAAGNSLLRSWILNPAGRGLTFEGGAVSNALALSTVSAADYALAFVFASSNAVDRSSLHSENAYSAQLIWSPYNRISDSALTGRGPGYGVSIDANSSFNAVTGCSVLRDAGNGVELAGARNLLARSRVAAAGDHGLRVSGSSNTVSESFVQGSTGAFLSGAVGAVLQASVFSATGTAGSGLRSENGFNLWLTSSVASGG
ncbi:MAG: right-handed parallel beta-helix repeat-containing protein, partial [Elusimicrobia bacterium]|nr:right-handed parallel beta-helix repeat-containing protein [Elusimicrobiota bacterium]